MFRIIVYYESAHGVTSTLVEFKTRDELKEATAIIDSTGEDSYLSYLELQAPPATIKRVTTDSVTTEEGNEDEE